MRLNLSRVHFPVTSLGPGSRVGIWFQGCSIRCPGCVSVDTWRSGLGQTTVDAVIDAIEPWLPEAHGVTISGGEPFEQPEALCALLTSIRKTTAIDILLYTGYSIEAVSHWLSRMEGLIDALISDPFQIDLPQTLPLRGSDNQRLHLLTDLGRSKFHSAESETSAIPQIDVMFDSNGVVWIAGIPKRDDLSRVAALLASDGHAMKTTEDVRRKSS